MKEAYQFKNQQEQCKKTENFKRMVNQHESVLATDGSGGPCQEHKCIAKVAAGAVAVRTTEENGTNKIQDIAFAGMRIPGKQTVPRAETWAVGKILEHLDEGNDTNSKTVNSDASYTVKGFASENKEHMRRGTNGDIWKTS